MENTVKNGSKFVRWNVVPIVLTILTVILGFMWAEIRNGNEVDRDLIENVSEIRTDIKWMKAMFINGNISIKRIW